LIILKIQLIEKSLLPKISLGYFS